MTAQAHEELIIDGQETSMAFCPPIPARHPRIKEVDLDNEARREDLPSIIGSTACWRGYIGTWEIKDGRFYLKDLIGCVELVGDEPLFANWFTGVLRVPDGDIIKYVHMGYGSLYEREHHIRIQGGNVTDMRTIENNNELADRERGLFDDFPGTENSFEGDDYWDDKS